MGRIDDVLIVRGINVYPSAVENIVHRFDDVGEFAVDVSRPDALDEMEVRIEVRDGDPASVAAAVAGAIRNAIGLRSRVTPVPFGTLPRFDLKARRFVDHRKMEDRSGQGQR
jgi:phenylacetate-CoA ligase